MGSWAAPEALRQGAKGATWITSACAWTRSKKPPSARILQGTAWAGSVEARYGADGLGPSLYVTDPEGNVVELKGPPAG